MAGFAAVLRGDAIKSRRKEGSQVTNDPTLDLILVVAFTAMVAIYFLPTLFLGWTFVGWWFALIWAIVGQREKVKPFYERSEPRL